MSRNPRLLASRPLDRAWRPIAQFTAMERLAAVVAAGIAAALLAGAVGADHYDSARRMANVQAALTARGLGSAHVERLWRGPYRCKHGYLWRTASCRSYEGCSPGTGLRGWGCDAPTPSRKVPDERA